MVLTPSLSKLSSKAQRTAYEAALRKYPSEDPFWLPRTCFRPPTAAVWETAASLARAADALVDGDQGKAIIEIADAERGDILAWGLPVMSTIDPQIIRWRPIDESTLPEERRIGSREPNSKALNDMYRRDGWRCRFCGTPVVVPKARRHICKLLPGAIRWTNSHGDHAGFEILSGVADHVQPHKWGGPSSLENLVTCCAPCNYGRGSAFLEEMGLIDPRTRHPYPANGWDGLTRVLAIPIPPRRGGPPPCPSPNMAAWTAFAHLVNVRPKV
jgi:5-methylcytosine-specific restriction endonuclease McrA